jgi:Phosphopantetheine attachment site.
MDKLIDILQTVRPDVDFTTEKNLLQSGVLDSLSIVMLVSDLQEAFDIEVTPVDIVPENFESAETIYSMIQRLQEKG